MNILDTMKVALLYSGGKDSTFALQHCKEQGWDIKYLMSVKPTRKDCFLFHFATVEHTPKIADMLNIPHKLLSCSVADPKQEAQVVRAAVEEEEKVDAVILGGTGLQETQIRSVQEALRPLNIEVFAAHAGEEHDLCVQKMLENNYEILISQIASDGLSSWLGKKITKENFADFKKDSVKYGFHVGGEGGYFDTLILDAPFFSKKLELNSVKKVMDDQYCGHVEIETKLINKVLINQ